MTELTDTIFLVSPSWRLLSIDLFNYVVQGELSAAGALATVLIVIVIIVVTFIYKTTGATESMFRM